MNMVMSGFGCLEINYMDKLGSDNCECMHSIRIDADYYIRTSYMQYHKS